MRLASKLWQWWERWTFPLVLVLLLAATASTVRGRAAVDQLNEINRRERLRVAKLEAENRVLRRLLPAIMTQNELTSVPGQPKPPSVAAPALSLLAVLSIDCPYCVPVARQLSRLAQLRMPVHALLLEEDSSKVDVWRRALDLEFHVAPANSVPWGARLADATDGISPVLFFINSKGCLAGVSAGGLDDSALMSKMQLSDDHASNSCSESAPSRMSFPVSAERQ